MKRKELAAVGLTILFVALACNLGSAIGPTVEPAPPEAIVQTAASPTPTAEVVHLLTPSSPPGSGQLVYDSVSQETASQGRAPYGDSYAINRLERPFKQDMTYIPDLDLWTYKVDGDATWWYVSIRSVGNNPNNDLQPNYGVELDPDHDGFGDYLIWAHSPLSTNWETTPVQIFQDKNHNTGGRSPEKSDAPVASDGYETLIFNGGPGEVDPDLAWVRRNADEQATVQFAFKKAWSGVVFMLGVIADVGMKDPGKLDYVDRWTILEAGSPLRENPNYPLKALFGVDNVCREAFGFLASGYEPQLCPREAAPPTKKPKPPTEQPPPSGCQDPGNCPYGWSGEPYCYCTPY